jgi:DNA-binding NarL/FixJ family response regulator
MPPIRIFVAEKQPGLCEWLTERITLAPDLEIVGGAHHGREVISAVYRLNPDILILGISLPEVEGLEVLRVLKWSSPNTKVIILSSHADETTILETLELGASGYIVQNGTDMGKLSRAVQRGEVWASRRVVARLFDRLTVAQRAHE